MNDGGFVFAMLGMKDIVDSHFHSLVMHDRGVDINALLSSLFADGFCGGIDAGCTHDDIEARMELLAGFPSVRVAAAMGPWEAGSNDDNAVLDVEAQPKSMDVLKDQLDVLKSGIEANNIGIVGEIGLDYYWEYGTHEKQLFLFEEQMKLASNIGAPVLIHDRDADDDTIDVIRRHPLERGGIIHCFDGCLGLMETALDNGYLISFAGNLTFKSNAQLRDALKKVPLDRLLFETDSPYLTPVPHRGTPNNPGFVVHTYECAAQVLGIPLEALKEQVAENFRKFVGELRS